MFSSCNSQQDKMWQNLITQNQPLMPSEDNAGDRCRLTNCSSVHDWHASGIKAGKNTKVKHCTKQARCVDQDKVDGHEELDSLAPLPAPASPQGVGGQLPDDTSKNLYDAQVFQMAELQQEKQERGYCNDKRKENEKSEIPVPGKNNLCC